MPSEATAVHRVAKMQLDKGPTLSTLKVQVPRDINPKELTTLHAVIVENVIKGLTGCPCMSGAVQVIFNDEFTKALNVDLHSGAVTQF